MLIHPNIQSREEKVFWIRIHILLLHMRGKALWSDLDKPVQKKDKVF